MNLEKQLSTKGTKKHEQIRRVPCWKYNPKGDSPNEYTLLFYFVPFVDESRFLE